MVLSKQSVAEAGKEFQNHAVGREGCVNSSRTVWWSERTSSSIHISEQRGAVYLQMHGATRHIHTLRQVLLPSNKNIVSHPQAIRCVSTVSGNRAMEQLLHKWCLCVLPKLITSVDKVRYICSSSTLRVFVNRLRRSVSLWRVKTQLLWQFTLIQRVC